MVQLTSDSCSPAPPSDLAVIGAGFSGLLLTLQVLRRTERARILLIERSESFARGLAYGAAHQNHLLNVRASNMSAFPDKPDHFLSWLRREEPASADQHGFASRQAFGRYLQGLLRDSVAHDGAKGRLILMGDEAVGVRRCGSRLKIDLSLGHSIEVDRIVLATGHLPPYDPVAISEEVSESGRYISDPWHPEATANVAPDGDVLIVGTGLTAIDVIQRLRDEGHRGRIVALSRRGLRPHRHADGAPPAPPYDIPDDLGLSHLLRFVRERARYVGWRAAVDGLRASTQAIWARLTLAERQRFLRHLRPWWDIHRHRLAPDVADRVEALAARGEVAFAAGRLTSVSVSEGGLGIQWQSRGISHGGVFDRMINCTGPAGDLTRTSSRLLQDLLRQGLARPDACHLGVDVDAECRVIDAGGAPQPGLFAIGPLSRGAFWEINAVPDIRVQADQLAIRLAADCERAVPAKS